jgi:O-succinylbenzoic acid--CoA ligase
MLVEAWLDRAARMRPEHPAVNAMTYAQLDAAAGADLPAGARVGIALPPGEDFVVALHATWRAGAVAVPLDLRLTQAERPAVDVLLEALPSGAPGAPRTHFELDDPAVVLFTSGTTAAPRPVTLTFGNLLWSAIGSAVAIGHAPDERWLCALPLSHVGGLSIVVRSAIAATTALVHEHFETDRVLAALQQDDVTLVSLVATTLARLLDAGLTDPPALRCALTGGGPVPPALVRRAGAAGVPVAQTYGMTEACSQITTQAPGDEQTDAGPPLFCTRVRIAEDREILVSGPTVAGGGELATGDLGALDTAGRLTVTGRKADTIVSGGENVAPQEIEAVLEDHPAVAEAAVFARPDAQWGEAVVAAVVLRGDVTEDELRAHCAARLAGFKVPKAIAFRAELPRTRSGKLARGALG